MDISQYSNVIADKLLKGWQLLDERCPVTKAVPLLKDGDGRKWSAAINDYVDQYARSKQTTQTKSPTTKRTGSEGRKRSPRTRSSPEATFVSSPFPTPPGLKRETKSEHTSDRRLQAEQTLSPERTSSTSAVAIEDIRESPRTEDRSQIVEQTIEALYVKIDSARRLLESTRDVSQSRDTALLIKECASAVAVLSDLLKSAENTER